MRSSVPRRVCDENVQYVVYGVEDAALGATLEAERFLIMWRW
jgi:hypothetical protein